MPSFWITTASGRGMDLADPQPDMVHFDDIAAGQIRLPRFTGQLKDLLTYYPVSEHSRACALVAKKQYPSGRVARDAFAHDFQESYIGDLNTLLKRLIEHRLGKSFKLIEEPIALAIRARYNLSVYLPREVKEIDARMLMTERRDFTMLEEGPQYWWPQVEPYGFTLTAPRDHIEAYHRFMDTARELGGFV